MTLKITDPIDVHDPRMWIKPYYPSFNGIRGLAVLMVFLTHNAYLSPIPHTGVMQRFLWVGVDLFFVLSGFLITGILYDSVRDAHYFRSFYVRRALRIFPVFYGFFLLVLVLTPLLHLDFGVTTVAAMFYVENLVAPFADLGRAYPVLISMPFHHHLIPVASFGHVWTLCVEEQFYLIWPTVVWAVRDRRKLMRICVIASIVVLFGRIAIASLASEAVLQRLWIYISTYTRCDTLLIGSWLALFLRGRQLSLLQLRRMSSMLFWPSAILALAGGCFRWKAYSFFDSPFTRTFGYTLIALAATGFLLRSLDEKSKVSRFLINPFLSELGIVSYGFYIYHGLPGITEHYFYDQHANVNPYLRIALMFAYFAAAFGLARLSFRYFETPFLRLKKILAPQKTAIS